MNKKPRKLILLTLLVLMCALFFSGCSLGGNPYTEPVDNGYVIKSMDVTIDASKGDRSMIITEKLVYNFMDNIPTHGFYRDLAINSGERIRDIQVSEFSGGGYSNQKYEVSHENGTFIRIMVRDENKLVPKNTDLTCTLQYKMITPNKQDADILMVNAIGQGFNCSILDATVKIILPAGATDSEYYIGEWGSSNLANDGITATNNADKTEYTLKTTKPLKAFNGLTVYYGMPNGTFTPYIDWEFFITLGIAIALILLVVVLKLKFGKSETLTPITNYYPPKVDGKAINPVELGFLIDNTCSGEDVTSLIFYWAANGYLNISNEDDSADNMRLLKVKDLPSTCPEYERNFFNKIFGSKSEVAVSELTNKTYTQVTATQAAVKVKYASKLYSGKVKAVRYGMCAAICIFAFLSVFLAYLRVNSSYFNLFAFVALVPVVISNLIGVYIVNNWLKFDKGKTAWLIGFVIITVLSAVIVSIFINYDVFSTLELIALAIGIIIPCLIVPFIVRRTDYYTAQLNELIGFREFLQAAEKDKLEMLLHDDPEYYYNILPYANVLGVSDIWEDKFKNLTIQPPTYYRSTNTLFNIIIFNSFYRSTYRHMATTVVSRPSSSGRSGGGGGFGGFGGGGGFSGGGFGGGGGGRC